MPRPGGACPSSIAPFFIAVAARKPGGTLPCSQGLAAVRVDDDHAVLSLEPLADRVKALERCYMDGRIEDPDVDSNAAGGHFPRPAVVGVAISGHVPQVRSDVVPFLEGHLHHPVVLV